MKEDDREFWKNVQELDDAAAEAGGFVEPGPHPAYRIKPAIELVKKLGRPLTDKEFKQFLISDEDE